MNKFSRGQNISILMLLTLLCSCAETPDGFFPSEKGVRWQYVASMQTMNGLERQKYIFTNIGSDSFDEEGAFLQKTYSGSKYIYKEDDTGIQQLGYIRVDDENNTVIPMKNYLLKHPLEPGKEWAGRLPTITLKVGGPRGVVISEDVNVKSKIASVNDRVLVEAGTFKNCVRVESLGEAFIPEGKYSYVKATTVKLKDTRWYAPGVGLVMVKRVESTTARLVNYGEFEMELESISL